MIPARRRTVRRIGALLLAAATLLLGGCIYLRLLDLKRQLGDFERNFALHTTDGLALVCRQPVLKADDVRWIGLKPETMRRVGSGEFWRVRWVKQLPPGVTEATTHDLALDLEFAEDRLARVAIPEQYFALMPKEFVTRIIRSVGGGQVDKAGRSLQATVAGSPEARPRLPAIEKLLGVPSERRDGAGETMTRYRYVPVTPEAGAAAFEMALHFDTASGELLRWRGRTPVGNVGFDFPRPAAP